MSTCASYRVLAHLIAGLAVGRGVEGQDDRTDGEIKAALRSPSKSLTGLVFLRAGRSGRVPLLRISVNDFNGVSGTVPISAVRSRR